MQPIRTYRHVRDVPQLTDAEVRKLSVIEEKFAFRANSYYLSLIDWNDPNDPLRKLVIPTMSELNQEGDLDASREADYTVARGLQHKYSDTALMLVAETCDSYCRYCFRKRLTMRRSDEIAMDPTDALAYIREHGEIQNVLLTGGDPLTLATGRLKRILAELSEMEHVRAVRIGTRIPAFRPQRILDDPALIDLLRNYSHPDRRIYIMAHFSHPRELTTKARRAIRQIKETGCEIMNQCPIIRGVNDNGTVLHELFMNLMASGVHPYYLFINRPTRGNQSFSLPIVEVWRILMEAIHSLPGLASTVRLVLSHHTGKLEVTGVDHDFIHLRYHRAAHPINHGRHLICQRNDLAVWFDELQEVHPHPSHRDRHDPTRTLMTRIPMRLDRPFHHTKQNSREN
ncbi:MAG: KamA family radical SAM protein [bacterium]